MRIHFTWVLSLLFFFANPLQSWSQLNMELQDSLTYSVGVNDVCGWASPDGKEYALVGLNTGVSIVDIDSDTIREVVFVPGVNNLWRDINTFGHYAYVSSEARVGLLIIDLQFLPDSVQTYIWKDSIPTPGGMRLFEKAHSLWVDEFGICYLNGSNINNGGVVLIDVATNPTNPDFLGLAPNIYSHDVYTRDKIIYSAEIYAGNLSIYDANDPQNITLLGRVKTPNEFTHNSWLSDNSQFMFTTDERPNSFVTSYDISDPGNIIELDRYTQAATVGLGNVPHNVYVWNDWVVVAYYANGTVILDASRPDNLVEVGNFDSFLGLDGGFPGVWGSFPWLPSGKIISSDRNSGLYVFIPTYVRACFLEGTVIDSVTRLPIHNAEVSIQSDEIVLPTPSKIDGVFKMGKAVPGQYNITVSKEGYFDKTIVGDFINGEILTPEIELVPYPSYTIFGKVIDVENADVPFAKVSLSGPQGLYETMCDENGTFLIPSVYEGTYEIQSGVWGQTFESTIVMDEPKTVTIQVLPGYYDDFDLDLGWTVSGTVLSGAWVRGLPTKQLLFDNWVCGSEGDSPDDIGGHAYSTGLSSSGNVENSEVNGGTTWLTSPPMDFTQYIYPQISFDYWLCEFPPNEYIGVSVWMTNGVDTFLLEHLRNDTITGSWQSKLYKDLALQAPLDNIQMMISATDTTTGTNIYIVKVHFDKFKVEDAAVGVDDPYLANSKILVYPNPVSGDAFYIKAQGEFANQITQINLFDVQGRFISNQKMIPGDEIIRVNHKLEHGLYLVQWLDDQGQTGVEKVMVLKK